MQYAASEVAPRDRYKILTAFVLPRPIAWVTTLGPTGVVNAAPFSFFNVFGEDPPLIMFAINKRPDGRLKDTWTNIKRTNEFVVHIPDEPMALQMHNSSGDFPPDMGEPDRLGLKLAPSLDIKVPRLADAPSARARAFTSVMSCGTTRQCPSIWRSITRSAACLPTATAAPTTAWISPQRRWSRPRRNNHQLRRDRPIAIETAA